MQRFLRLAIVAALTAALSAATPASAANPSALEGSGAVKRSGGACTGTGAVAGAFDGQTGSWLFSGSLVCGSEATAGYAFKKLDSNGCAVGPDNWTICVTPLPQAGQTKTVLVTICPGAVCYSGSFPVSRY